MKGFGTRLRQLREERGLTQVELARAAGTTWMQISRYERDLHLPAADKLAALARVLRVSADMLLWGDVAGKQAIDIKNIRLYERFRAVDDLPKHEQETILRLVDAVLAKHRLEHLADQTRTTV